MIEINCINGSEERKLTAEERATGIIATVCDGVTYKHYQKGDKLPEIAPDLEGVKLAARTLIDRQTEASIRAGFSFRNVVFSMSDNAQHNWGSIKNDVDPETDFPFTIAGKDDENIQVVHLMDMDDMNEFTRTVYLFKKGLQQAGTVRKIQVNACKTVEEVKTLIGTWGISI